MTTPPVNDNRPVVGISACLVGQRVRYDGLDKFNALVAEQIAPHCRLLPFCPEAVAGMGIPRPPINLVQTPSGIRAVGKDSPHWDVTDRLQTVANIMVQVHTQLCGYILQSRSPSCGLDTTPILDADGNVVDPSGSGLLAATLRRQFPALPLLNDTDLNPESIQRFLQQIQDYGRSRYCSAPNE